MTTEQRKRDVRYVSIEPGRINLHGIALTDGEMAVLRGIAERMKRSAEVVERFEESLAEFQEATRSLEC